MATISNAHRLKLEIGLALTLKVVLLIGLWWLLYRYGDRPASPVNISEHLFLPPSQSESLTLREIAHDR